MRYKEACFSDVEVINNIPFSEARNERGELEQLALDVYTPQGDTEKNRPVIVWVHGGGFRPGNNKSQKYIVEFSRRFARKGYVCAAPDYRVRENPKDDLVGTISEAIADVAAALEWVRHNSEAYGIDSKRIVLAGGSAGGMTVVNMCYGDGTYGTQPDLSGIQAVMNLWGTPRDMKLSVRESSLPICIVHGTEDQSVKFDSSVSFVDMLQKASVPHTFLPLEGAPHTPMAHVERIDEEMTRFLSNCAEQWGD